MSAGRAASHLLTLLRRHDYVVIDARAVRAAAEAAEYAAEDYAERANYEDKTDGDEGSEFQDAADRYSDLAATLRAAHDRLEF
jgi:hypothetical protein